MLETALEALLIVMSPGNLLYMFLGILIGLMVGFIPGIGSSVGLALVLPFVYGMDPYAAVVLMIGVVGVTNTSDTFTSVLFGIPGTSSSQATIMDGYPLAQQGKAAVALGAAFMSSMIGGIIGAIFLFISIPI